MAIIFIIGGMGSGKSTARRALTDLGLAAVDFDLIGHKALALPEVKEKLAQTFGSDVIDAEGSIDRALVARRAFATDEATAALNAITLPAIERLFKERIAELESAGEEAIVAETSNFRRRDGWLMRDDDIVMAIVAPVELRVARTVAAGWNEDDVRRRIAQQMTDEERIAAADVVFDNSGSFDDLRSAVQEWWRNRARL